MVASFAEKAMRDVQVVRRLARYVIEITANDAIVCQHNPAGPLGVIAVVGPVEKSFIGDVDVKEGLLLEVGLGHVAPYRRSERFRRNHGLLPVSAGFDIKFRHKYFALSKAQYLLLAPHLFQLLQDITDSHVRARRSGNMEDPFIVPASTLRIRRYAGEVVHWETWQRRVRGIRFDIDTRDEYLVADLCKITLRSQWLTKEVSGLHGFVTRCLERYSPRSSYDRLMRNKYSSAAVEALRRPSLKDYTISELLQRMKKHPMVEFVAYVTSCFEPSTVHVLAQKALPKIQRRTQLLSQEGCASMGAARINTCVHELNGRLNIEVMPSNAARFFVAGFSDPNQLEMDELMLTLGHRECNFDDEPPF